MAIDIDGYAVLGAIAARPAAFPSIGNEVSKVARTLVVKQLKEKSVAIGALREIADAVDHEAFELILDLMGDPEIKSLVGKVDKLNAEAKTATPQWQRKHLAELAGGRIEPSAKKVVAKPSARSSAKPSAAPGPAVERAGNARFSKARKKA